MYMCKINTKKKKSRHIGRLWIHTSLCETTHDFHQEAP